METPLQRSIKYLLRAAFEAGEYVAMLDPDEDAETIDYYISHAILLRTLANEWDQTIEATKPKTNVVQFPGTAQLKPFPRDRARRERPPYGA